MADIDTQVAQLKKRIADTAKERAKAEHQQEVARDHVAEAERLLREEFDTAPEDVPALIRQAEADLEAEAQRVREWLDKAEGKA